MLRHDFIKLYDESYDDIYRYIYFKTNSKWETDDLVSEIFKRAYEKFDTVTGNYRAWLFTIARNSVIDYYRKKNIFYTTEDINDYVDSNNIEDNLVKKDLIEYLKKSLESLPMDEMEIIMLRYFYNMKFKDISKITGKNKDFLKTKASRILKKLRILVKKHMEG
ncbi:RNA polymerase sigma factor [Candidatus Clostridium stratigraminis]|uniref:RNA polymerase sigma factor n=1 Tax=Candidatus Clostridium stratigraminis TaxID=3381661 RepID=A0ABW8T9V3_9CLOT